MDSILTAIDSSPIMKSEYYKVGENLPDLGVAMAQHPYTAANDDMVLGALIIATFILALALFEGKTIYKHRLKEFFNGKRTYSKEEVNENDRQANSTFFLMSVCAFALSLMAFDESARVVGFERAIGIPYWLFAAGYAVFMGYFYAKAWIYKLVNWTFFDQESSLRWLSGYLLLTSLSAYIILPVTAVFVLVPEYRQVAIWVGLFALFLYEGILFFKMFVNFNGKNYGYLLLFLYFCSVELMPNLVMCRLTVWAINNVLSKLVY